MGIERSGTGPIGDGAFTPEETIDGRHCHAIGDVMIDSDFLMVCLEDAVAPAYLRHAGDRGADTAVNLLEAVVAGRLAV